MTVAHRFVEALTGDEGVLGVWIRANECGVEIVTVTKPLDENEELRLFRIEGDLLREFPDANVQLAVYNPSFFSGDVFDLVPDDALPVSLTT